MVCIACAKIKLPLLGLSINSSQLQIASVACGGKQNQELTN